MLVIKKYQQVNVIWTKLDLRFEGSNLKFYLSDGNFNRFLFSLKLQMTIIPVSSVKVVLLLTVKSSGVTVLKSN